MPSLNHFDPEIVLPRSEARRFMLWQQYLMPAHSLEGKQGIMTYIQRVGCVQFDPVSVVGWSPHLVLQARVRDYQPHWLEELLYRERRLWDGWDKVQSIYPVEDYPCFAFRREENRRNHWLPHEQVSQIHPHVLAVIQQRGPISSLDLKSDHQIDGWWGVPVRVERAALENLYNMGEIGIHHRVGTRRYFDLTSRLLPAEIHAAKPPFNRLEEYHDWHVLRRIGGMGLASSMAGEAWGGILSMKSHERLTSLRRLVERGELNVVGIEGVEGKTLFLRNSDWQAWQEIREVKMETERVVFLPPLDNLLWQREVIRWLFDFDYIWEVYKPPAARRFGAYTLPVLFGERFIARCDAVLERRSKTLKIRGWWWEAGVEKGDARLRAAVRSGLTAFQAGLGAERLEIGAELEVV
ncbi:MAG: crosslink repair DNA glycosylase YcaQ family protein [Chloroflexota bacterium]